MIAELRRARSQARARLRLDRGAADRARRVRARPAPAATGWWSSIPTRCRRCWSNQSYYSPGVGSAKKPTDKTYLTDCLQSATWLVRALDQRAKTILKVATEIVRQQDAFFAHGVQHLRPLNLKTVADAIGMHESTVSRVTANKYMATPRGIFELKYFFTSSIAAARRRRGAFGRGGAPPHQAADRRRDRRTTSCPTTPSSRGCATPASTSPAARWRNIARRCGSRRRCSAGARSRARWPGREGTARRFDKARPESLP